jgi:uncharacterized membrane protein
MKRGPSVIRTTVIGGAFFLLPIVVLALVLGKIFQLAAAVAKPLEQIVPIDTFIGVVIVNFIAIFGLLVICYLAGLIARIEFFRQYASRAEELLLGSVPGYAFIKTMASGLAQADNEMGKMNPVLVRLDEMYQMAFEVERTPKGYVVVYLPGAPNPWSGTVAYFTPDRIINLNLKATDAMKLVQVLGRGSGRFADEAGVGLS